MPSIFQFFRLPAPSFSRSALRHSSFAIRHSLPAPRSLLRALRLPALRSRPEIENRKSKIENPPAPRFTLSALQLFSLSFLAASAQVVPDLALPATILPAGTELVRDYATDRIAVQVTSRPFFGATSAEWATVEVGPASLAFLREKDGGAVLLLGDQPLVLPDPIALGPDGRSAAPFSFELSYDRAEARAILAVGARSFQVTAAAPAGPLVVVVAPGAAAEWRLDALQITPGPAASPPLPAPSSSLPAPGSPSPAPSSPLLGPALAAALAAKQQALAAAAALVAAGNFASAERVLETASPRAKDSAAWHLEVAGGLVRLALAAAARGEPAPALAATAQALTRLDQAAARATPAENALAANALGLRGWLEERFLGDWSAAKLSYQLAEQRWPQGPAGRQAQRLATTERESALRGRGPGG